jgi:hypothetical protein
MNEQDERIVAALLHVARKSGSLVTHDAALTGSAVLAACVEWEGRDRELVIPELKDAPAWAAYELKILHLGRAIDFVMRKLGCWKGRGPLLDAAAEVVAELRFGRGRQSFAGTLGEHGEGAYGVELAALLSEEGMAGYAIKALHRSANGEYLDAVLAAAQGGRPWVQSAARAYGAEFGSRRRSETTQLRRSRRAPAA